jgi:hypothetical protein
VSVITRSIILIENRREKIGTEKTVRFLEVSGFQKFRNSEVTLYDHTVTEESYDTFRSFKSVKYSNSVTYSTLQRKSKATGENDENLSDDTRVPVSRDEHDENNT